MITARDLILNKQNEVKQS